MIPTGHIHIWFVSLDRNAHSDCDWDALLSREVRQRAAGFRFARDRDRFIVAHGILRRVLEGYLPQPPTLIYGTNGKPALACGSLYFNLSHTDDRALIAVSATGELGVDLERVRLEPDASGIADYCFSPLERMLLSRVPQTRRAEAFFKCWTRKEAFVKALGDGLSYPLKEFSVSLDEPSDAPAHILDLGGDKRTAAQWSVHHLVPEPGFVGAIVAHYPIFQVVSMSLGQLEPAAHA